MKHYREIQHIARTMGVPLRFLVRTRPAVKANAQRYGR